MKSLIDARSKVCGSAIYTNASAPRLVMFGQRPLKAGIYLCLFHGRPDPGQVMRRWGQDGPMIGPLNSVLDSYAERLQLNFSHPEDARLFGVAGSPPELRIDGDMIEYQGIYYSDWLYQLVLPEHMMKRAS